VGGPKFLKAVGNDALESILSKNIPINTADEKFNEAIISSVDRIAAILEAGVGAISLRAVALRCHSVLTLRSLCAHFVLTLRSPFAHFAPTLLSPSTKDLGLSLHTKPRVR